MKLWKTLIIMVVICLISVANGLCEDNSFVVDENGNVGVGAASPTAKLHIKATTANNPTLLEVLDTKGTPGPLMNILDTEHYSGKELLRLTADSDADAGGPFYTVFTAAGNVGVGTASPTAKLHVQATTANDPTLLRISDTSGTTGPLVNILDTEHSGKELLRLTADSDADAGGPFYTVFTASGDVGIGTTTPSYKLDVNGTIRGKNLTPSDARWKTNINTMENSLEKVSKLRGVTYEWAEPSRGTGNHIGVIAQEVEVIFPEVVSTDNEGYKSVAYSNLVAPLIEAVKTLKTENDQLKQDNKEIRQQLAKIMTMLEKLQ
ncbi:MAG: hypothetical protein GY710_01475 [Desulfobacteraceae bacterium]|nr:hypothetical protein [Desulfobacteraceae bacterium]